MRITGQARLAAPPQRVRACLAEPAAVAAALGAARGRATGPGTWTGMVPVTLAAVAGTYAVRATASAAEDGWTVALAASGDPGALTGVLQVRVEGADGGSLVAWEADVEPEGRLAAVGRAVLDAAVRRLAGDALAALDTAAADLPPGPQAAPSRAAPLPAEPPLRPSRAWAAAVPAALLALLVWWRARRR